MDRYLLGADFGGSATKVTVLRDDGCVVASATREYPTYYPENGWTEQNPEELFAAFLDALQDIFSQGIKAETISAMAISAASQTAVYLDRDGRPVRPSIYWTDSRGAAYAEELKKRDGERIYSICCNMPTSARTITHLRWIREHEPENFKRIQKVMFVKDYVRYRLTGDFVTDPVDAMGSMLFNARDDVWDKELCAYAGLTEDQLPQIKEPTALAGSILPEMQRQTGLCGETAVIVGSTDTVMEVYANGAIRPGQMTIKLATAGRICPITRQEIQNPLLINYKHVVPGLWYPGTGTKSCAASYRWYRDVLGGEERLLGETSGTSSYQLMDQAAENIFACQEGIFFHPYLQGELTPYFDPALRGSFTGIASYHTKGHFNRAVLEGVAFSLKDCYEILKKENVSIDQAILIGGGARSRLWSQIVCDCLNLEMVKTQFADSSLGSAMLAGVATGRFSSFEDSVEKCVHIERSLSPDGEAARVYQEGFEKYKAIHDALAPVYREWQKKK